jgi:hypothetical protein
LPSFNDALPFGENSNEHALAWDAVSIAPWDGWQAKIQDVNTVSDALIADLRARSDGRRNSPERKFLEEYAKYFNDKICQKHFSLEMSERLKQREDDRSHTQQFEADIKQLAQENYEFHDVILDATADECELQNCAKSNANEKTINDFDVHLWEALHILLDWILLPER